MKAQQGNGAGWRWEQPKSTANTSQAPHPAKPQALNSLRQSRREGLGEGPSWAAGIKEKQGKQPEQCLLFEQR